MCPHCRLVVCECVHTGTRTIPDLMADMKVLADKRAAIEPRGHDSIQQREVLMARIDRIIDEIQLRVAVAQTMAEL